MLLRLIYLRRKCQPMRDFLRNVSRSREVQRKVLLEKLARNSDSQFGRAHGFQELRTVDDFRRRMPIVSYEYFRPHIERVQRGDTRALFGPGVRVLMFAVTSGTTGKPKYIPITNHYFEEYRRSWNIWGSAVYRDHIDLVWKQTLQFSGDWRSTTTEGGIPCGNVSGLAAETRPFLARLVFALPAIVNKVEGVANKQYLALRLTLHRQDIGMVITANPLTLLNLARLADARKESLIRDCYDGTVARDIDLPSVAREQLRGRLGRRRRRSARRLERIVETTGHLLPRDFWYRMSVLAVWTGGSMSPYLNAVRSLYGEVAFRDHGLSASEGRMTTPFGDDNRAGFMDYIHHYFEFIPVEEYGGEMPTVLEGHELLPGRDYHVVLTTSGGLYRYDIHDVVRCVDMAGSCPLLEFLHKGANFSSMAGEKLSEHQVIEAVGRALKEANVECEHYMLVAELDDPPRYCLLLDKPLAAETLQSLPRQVDTCLSEVNCEYRDRLASNRLGSLRIRLVPPESWERLQNERLAKRGGSPEQYKHPFLVSDTKFIQRFLPRRPSHTKPLEATGA